MMKHTIVLELARRMKMENDSLQYQLTEARNVLQKLDRKAARIEAIHEMLDVVNSMLNNYEPEED